jgi:hypothetical protein
VHKLPYPASACFTLWPSVAIPHHHTPPPSFWCSSNPNLRRSKLLLYIKTLIKDVSGTPRAPNPNRNSCRGPHYLTGHTRVPVPLIACMHRIRTATKLITSLLPRIFQLVFPHLRTSIFTFLESAPNNLVVPQWHSPSAISQPSSPIPFPT